MATRIKTKQEDTVWLSTLVSSQMFRHPGQSEANQFCAIRTGLFVTYNLVTARMNTYLADQEVIPIDRDDLLPGKWRVWEREPAEATLGGMEAGKYFCWKLTGNDVFQTGDMEGELRRYWNVCCPSCEHVEKPRVLAIPLKPTSVDPDGTIVFSEL